MPQIHIPGTPNIQPSQNLLARGSCASESQFILRVQKPDILPALEIPDSDSAVIIDLELSSQLQQTTPGQQQQYEQHEQPAMLVLDTWAGRWVVMTLAYLLPPDRREEWLGDSYEIQHDMVRRGYPRWWINIINIGRTIVLIGSAVEIKVTDFLSIGDRESE